MTVSVTISFFAAFTAFLVIMVRGEGGGGEKVLYRPRYEGGGRGAGRRQQPLTPLWGNGSAAKPLQPAPCPAGPSPALLYAERDCTCLPVVSLLTHTCLTGALLPSRPQTCIMLWAYLPAATALKKARTDSAGALVGLVAETLEGLAVVQAFGKQEYFIGEAARWVQPHERRCIVPVSNAASLVHRQQPCVTQAEPRHPIP